MRVLYIVSAYSRSETDVITPWLNETIRRLASRGVEVEVLAPSYRGSGTHLVDDVVVHRFRYAPRRLEDLTHDQTAPDRIREKPGYLALVPGYVASGSAVAAHLARSGRFDVVHVHWPIPHGILGLAARRAGDLPLVSTFHGVELTWTARMPFVRSFVRRLIRTSDAVTANSSHTESLIRQVADRPVVRVPFGSALEVPASLPAREARPVAGPFRLLFVGRLVERKGLRHALEALAELRERRPIRLDIVGDGPLRSELEERARALGLSDLVTFHGFVPAEELARRYDEADAFVLPAVQDAKGDVEGLGVVLIEALGRGVPVVASASGGIVDIVLNERTGLLVPPGDAGALATAVDRLAADPAVGVRLGAAGRAHVDANFSWPAIADRLANLYARLAS